MDDEGFARAVKARKARERDTERRLLMMELAITELQLRTGLVEPAVLRAELGLAAEADANAIAAELRVMWTQLDGAGSGD